MIKANAVFVIKYYSLKSLVLTVFGYLSFRMYQEKLQDFKQQLQNLNSGMYTCNVS